MSFTAAAILRRLSSRRRVALAACNRPFADDGVPTQPSRVPSAARSSLQMLLAWRVAFPQSILYIKGVLRTTPRTPAGTIFVGHAPIVRRAQLAVRGEAGVLRAQPVLHLVGARADVADARALRLPRPLQPVGVPAISARATVRSPGANALIIDYASCITTAQFQKDEAAAIAAGSPRRG